MLTQVLATAQQQSDPGMTWPLAAVLLGFFVWLGFVVWTQHK
jgi:hypothetical protein